MICNQLMKYYGVLHKKMITLLCAEMVFEYVHGVCHMRHSAFSENCFDVQHWSALLMVGALHSVVGRRIFETWNITKSLLEDRNNGIQDAIWEVILNRGEGTLVDLAAWDKEAFEHTITEHTKPVLRIGGDPV